MNRLVKPADAGPASNSKTGTGSNLPPPSPGPPENGYPPAAGLKRFPNSDQLAPAYLIVAQALANGLQQWEKASAFLAFIQKRCADHPVHQDIEVWLEQARNRQPLKGPKASFQVPD